MYLRLPSCCPIEVRLSCSHPRPKWARILAGMARLLDLQSEDSAVMVEPIPIVWLLMNEVVLFLKIVLVDLDSRERHPGCCGSDLKLYLARDLLWLSAQRWPASLI